MLSSMARDAYIVDAVRSPIGRRNGSLSEIRADELAAQVLNGLVERVDVDPGEIEERRTRDPLKIAGSRLDDDERRAIEERCEQRLAETVEAADAAPAATPEAA